MKMPDERYEVRKVWINGEGYFYYVVDTHTIKDGKEKQIGVAHLFLVVATDIATDLNAKGK
jgi:hypothetical protein